MPSAFDCAGNSSGRLIRFSKVSVLSAAGCQAVEMLLRYRHHRFTADAAWVLIGAMVVAALALAVVAWITLPVAR